MAINFTCPNGNCGKRLRVKDDLAGKCIRCPACGAEHAVHGTGGSALAPVDRAGEEAEASSPAGKAIEEPGRG